ncbi:hypothetical protein JW948_17435 [bacterium]|nr:hypothetical protein [bacterium]
MRKGTWLKILNPVLGILVVNQAATGMMHDALDREVFETMHEGGGVVLVVLSVIHLILNWNWIRANYSRKKTGS